MKKTLFRLLSGVATFAILFYFYRLFFCPVLMIANGVELSQEVVDTLQARFKGNLLNNADLGRKLAGKKIILVGETHFEPVVMRYFTDILDKIPGKKIILNLELPESMQGPITSYMETGDEKYFAAIKACSDCLPYHDIIKWCRDHRAKVEAVFAVDEDPSTIFLRRCICDDTRNQTMTRNILKSYRLYPGRLVVFYGGQLHCLLNGRYLYNVENRTPVGKLLLQNGNSINDIVSVLLDYENHFPSAPAWQGRTGAVEIGNVTVPLPVNFFVRDTVFGVKYANEAFDFFVNVGNLN